MNDGIRASRRRAAAFAFSAQLAASAVPAQTYKHVDAEGRVTFTNAPVDPAYELHSGPSAPAPAAVAGGTGEEGARAVPDVPDSRLAAPPRAAAGDDMHEQTFRYEYDAPGRLRSVDRGGSVTTYEYDDRNNLVRRTRDGVVREYEVDARNRVIRMRERR